MGLIVLHPVYKGFTAAMAITFVVGMLFTGF